MSTQDKTRITEAVPSTITTRLRRSRAAALFLLLFMAAPVYLGLSARTTYLAHRAPDFGLRSWYGLNVGLADARWPGVQRDDDLLRIDGRTFTDSVQVQDYLLAHAPGAMTVTFARGERQWTITAESRPWPLGDIVASWLRFCTGALMFCIGLGVYLARPDAKISLLFLLFTYVSAMAVLYTQVAPGSAWEGYAFPFVIGFTSSFGLHLFSVFPVQNGVFARRRWLARAIYLPPTLTAPLWSWPGIAPQVFSAANLALWLWLGICTLLGNSMLVWSYVRAWRNGDRLSMSRGTPVLIGVAVGFIVPTAVQTLIALAPGWGGSRLLFELSISFIAVFAIGMGYSVVRYNAMAVDRFTAAILAYGTSVVFLCVGYGALIGGVWLGAYLLGIAESQLLTVIVTAASSLGLRPAFSLVKGRLDRLFARERVTAEKTLEILQQLRTRTQSEAPRDEALREVLQALAPLGHQRAELWLLSDEGDELMPKIAIEDELGAGPPEDPDLVVERVKSLASDGGLARSLRSGQSGGIRGLCPRELEPEVAAELWSAGLVMAVPLAPHGEFAGFLGLGRRKSGASYGTEELVLAGHVGNQAAVILERSTGTRMGRYRIEKRLGVGGMAEVFLARQMGPGGFERRVALKRPLPDMAEDPKFIAMFLEEARIAARLQHENIAQIYEVDKHHDHYYLTMEYVDGPSVRTLLRDCAKLLVPVPVPVALTITADLLKALAHVHAYVGPEGQQLALIHRDVNPNNVLLRTDGKGKLVDFGIARAGDRLLRTQTGHVRGTIPYMSPEQARAASDIDQRTDIYSAAVVCYEMLTTLRAFPNGPVRERPKALCAARPDAPAALEAVLARGMAFQRDERPATAGDLLDELVRATGPALVTDYPAVAALIAKMTSAPSGGESAPVPHTIDATGTFA